jgi:ABC-type multidrug transport system ATPase subunit
VENNAVFAENISKSYNGLKAVKNISFFAGKGEIFGFIGPDGAGKTSLFRVLVTLLLPDEGRAMVSGLDVVKDFRKVRNILGYMPGKFSLYQDLSVEQNLNFYATIFGTTVKENYHLIKDIYSQIEPFKDRLAGQLSGGMKQKLALSCALIHKPELLVLDEPTTGVDAVSRKEFWEMLSRLKEQGITILVSTPYMDEAVLCDRVALIQEGSILRIDTPEAITRSFPKPVFAVKAAHVHDLLDDLKLFDGVDTANLFGNQVHLVMKDNTHNAAQIIEYLAVRGRKDVMVTKIDAGIEDCFIDLMLNKA